MRLHVTRVSRCSSVAVAVVMLTACSGLVSDTGGAGTPNGVAGSWATPNGAQTRLSVQLLATGSSLSGAGTLGVPPITPITGPATPAYTGDNFTITSGSFSSPTVSFTATLGANPNGSGGFYNGTLSFAGTVNGGTMSGTLTFTPPRTVTQTFAAQTVSGVTLTKP